MTAISFTYAITPPEGIDPSTVSRPGGGIVPGQGEASFPIAPAPPTRSPTDSFYASATAALSKAQVELMAVLSPWKEAVGDVEKVKENPGKVEKGQGKAARLMAAAKADEVSDESDDDEAW